MSITSGDLKKAKLATSRLFYFIDRVPKIDSGKEDGVKQVWDSDCFICTIHNSSVKTVAKLINHNNKTPQKRKDEQLVPWIIYSKDKFIGYMY